MNLSTSSGRLSRVGLLVKPVLMLGERVHPETGWQVAYVACRLLAGTARVASPREVAEVRWVRLGEIPGQVPGGLFAPVQAYLNEQLAEL
ncbi:hypothetical protein [Streptomyces sp. NPDC001530]|uniref:hypothetical protein n=1 Tax=Streptomyces sp. NPDC001530 TaxID=3364582 RepID=UPI00368E2BB1